MTDFETLIDGFSTSIGAAKDGGKQAVNLMNEQREAVITAYASAGVLCRGCLQGRDVRIHVRVVLPQLRLHVNRPNRCPPRPLSVRSIRAFPASCWS